MEFLNYTFKIGSTEFTVAAILAGLFVLIIAYIINKLIKRFFTKRLIPKLEKDKEGIAKSYLRILSYIIFITALLIALKSAGIEISYLFAGGAALLVGIGFGIQNIVNNFISGIILLFEKPIKEGDLIEVDGVLGTVTSISTRSTRIDTISGVTIFIPNSKLLENKLINRSHTLYTEIEVPLIISYNTEFETIRDILLGVAKEIELILEDPSPSVSLRELSDSYMQVKLFVWIQDQQKYAAVRSQLNQKILQEFKKHNIKFPVMKNEVTISQQD